MSVVGPELADVRVQRLVGEGVDAGVDFALLRLISPQSFLFNDAIDFIAPVTASRLAENRGRSLSGPPAQR